MKNAAAIVGVIILAPAVLIPLGFVALAIAGPWIIAFRALSGWF